MSRGSGRGAGNPGPDGGLPVVPPGRGASGPGISRRALAAGLGLLPFAAAAQPAPPAACRGTLYLTIDTGWSREAEEIAAILRRRQVRATLFLADEPTFRGDRTLGESWAGFWRARAAEGHVFGSHTWRHWVIGADPGPGRVRYARPGQGSEVLDEAGFCAELRRPIEQLREMVPDAQVLPLWRAPGGRTSPNAVAMAKRCGLTHQGWSANGFLGDELDSDRQPNSALLQRALRSIRDGEVLLLHWGVRSRKEPFAEVLEPLIAGLQEKGFCFATLPPGGKA